MTKPWPTWRIDVPAVEEETAALLRLSNTNKSVEATIPVTINPIVAQIEGVGADGSVAYSPIDTVISLTQTAFPSTTYPGGSVPYAHSATACDPDPELDPSLVYQDLVADWSLDEGLSWQSSSYVVCDATLPDGPGWRISVPAIGAETPALLRVRDRATYHEKSTFAVTIKPAIQLLTNIEPAANFREGEEISLSLECAPELANVTTSSAYLSGAIVSPPALTCAAANMGTWIPWTVPVGYELVSSPEQTPNLRSFFNYNVQLSELTVPWAVTRPVSLNTRSVEFTFSNLEPRPKQDDPAKDKTCDENAPGVCCDPETNVGDPVDTSSGTFYDRLTLLRVNGATPLEMVLNYRSDQPVDGALGFGWSHDFTASLVDSGTAIDVTWPGGRTTRFLPDGDAYLVEVGNQQDRLNKLEDGSYQLSDQRRWTYLFNPVGELLEIQDLAGRRKLFSYSSGLLTEVSETLSGMSLAIAYDGDDRISQVSSAGAGALLLGYDAAGDLVTITDALGYVTSFTYDADHRLTTKTDGRGNLVLVNVYDDQGRVISQDDGFAGTAEQTFTYGPFMTQYTDPQGGVTTYLFGEGNTLLEMESPGGVSTQHSYDADGNQLSQVAPNGQRESYTYDADGYRTSRTDPLGNTWLFAYDANHNVIAETDPLGSITRYAYDADNRLVRTTDAAGHQTLQSYTAEGFLASVNDSDGGRTSYGYTNGRRTSVTDPTGRTTTYAYDEAGRLVAITDQAGKSRTYSYDLKGQLLVETDPLGRTTSYSYDANGNRLTRTDALGRVTSYAYDLLNRQVSETDPLGQVTGFEYDPLGNLVKTIYPDGSEELRSYDAEGRMISLQTGGRTQLFYYDPTGNLTSIADSAGWMSYGYDALGRRVVSTDNLGQTTHYAYDGVNNLVATTDPLGRVTRYSYDPLNRLVGTEDSAGGNSSQGFSAAGQRLSLVDAGGVKTTFSYDAAGRLTRSDADGVINDFTYDVNGRVASKTNGRGQTTSYSYDAAGQLTGSSDPAGTVLLNYDAVGNRLAASDPAGTLSYTYDALNRIASYTDVFGNTIGYSYDVSGNLAQLTYPDGKTVTYGYNSAGQMTSVTDWASRVTSYGYDPAGRLIQTTNADGTKVNISYDSAGQPTTVVTLAPDAAERYRYTYQYDAGGQVTEETGLPRQPADDVTMTYAGNRLATWNGQAVSYDADGNMVFGPLAGAMTTYSFDARDRLTQVGATSYSYDAEDRRVAVDANSTVTRQVVDPNARLSRLLMETDASGTPIAWYVYGLGLVGRQGADNSYRTYHYDLRGSTVALTDEAGWFTDSYQYGPYGELLDAQGATGNRFLYNGRDGVVTDQNGLY